MSDFEAILSSAAAEAQSTLGEAFIGPDGKSYTGVFRSASAFELAAIGQEMSGHGFNDKTAMVVAATRTQFTTAPYNWRRKKLFRTSPRQECNIVSVNADDRFWYVFPVTFNQPNA